MRSPRSAGIRLRALPPAPLVAMLMLLADPCVPDPARSQSSPAAGVRTVYLVRHGAYDEADTLDDAVGRGLVPLGREQAGLVAARLAALPDSISGLSTSPFTRARETAEIIARAFPGLRLEVRPEIAECTPPNYRADVMAKLDPGEADSCRARFDRAFAAIFRPAPAGNLSEIYVCHGNVIRYFVVRALGVEPMAWLGMSIVHASITVIQVRPDGTTRLHSFDDAGHLPPRLQTVTGTRTLSAPAPAPAAGPAPAPAPAPARR